MMTRSEFELIRDLAARMPPGAGSDSGFDGAVDGTVDVGIGDDCAVVTPAPGALLLTTDLLVEGRHFVLDGLDPADLGWKALAVSVSDVAAMGGRARYAIVSVALKAEQAGEFADRLADGLAECARRYGVAVVGGDTVRAGAATTINVALVGSAAPTGAVLRSGARPGDALCVTGALGGSLSGSPSSPMGGRHLRPEARQEEASALVQGGDVHAMIDLSDGLSSDLGHVLDASGVGARIDGWRVPVHGDVVAVDPEERLDRALHDGEDFELLFAVPQARATALTATGLCETPVTQIGQVTSEREFLLVRQAGAPAQPMPRGGHDHFRTR